MKMMKAYIGQLTNLSRLAMSVFVLLALAIATPAFAQGPANGGPVVFPNEPPVGDTPPPTEVPIDGGASLLLAACAGYGVKKLKDRRKNRTRS